jgi:GTP cyclohydrolase II
MTLSDISGSQPRTGEFRKLSSCNLPTEYGSVELRVYGWSGLAKADWVVCTSGVIEGQHRVQVRVHDACLTSEVLGSLKCDCALQLRLFQQCIAKHGGVLIYTPQEGRGIGLANKVAAYALQEQGLDTVDANTALGLPEEARDYTVVPYILRDLGVISIVLLTNNPFKLTSLRKLGVQVTNAATIVAPGMSEHCKEYVRTKAQRMGHVIPGYSAPPEPTALAQSVASPRVLQCLPVDDEDEPSEPSDRSNRLSSPDPGWPATPGEDGPTRLVTLSSSAPPSKTVPYAALLRTLRGEIAAVARMMGTGPFLTLTYAQTLDGSIAGPLGASGPRLMLSGERSMAMTHALRAVHDAIVVGIGTALADDPKLTVMDPKPAAWDPKPAVPKPTPCDASPWAEP